MKDIDKGFGLYVKDVTRFTNMQPKSGCSSYFLSNISMRVRSERLIMQRRVMRFLPVLAQLLLLSWLLPLFFVIGYRFRSGHFIVMGFFFSIVISMVVRARIKDKYL